MVPATGGIGSICSAENLQKGLLNYEAFSEEDCVFP